MLKPPVPIPRTCHPKQGDTEPKIQDMKPPPVTSKSFKAVSSIEQSLPVMVQSNSMPESDQKNGGGEVTMQTNNVEDGKRYLTLQHTSQTLVKSTAQGTLYTTRRMLMTQQTWNEDFQQPLNSKLIYQRSGSIPEQDLFQCHPDTKGNVDIMGWWNSDQSLKKYPDTKKDDAKAFRQKAENLMKALFVYDYLLSVRGANLQGHIIELEEVANGIDKVHKGVKIAGIAGGAAGAVGVAAAVGGVILAPFTLGVSLALTAVGVGVAAAGGVTGASAAITNKVHTNMDRKKVETILKEHSNQMEEIERCVKFIGTHIESLKKYDLSTLKGVDCKSVKVARMAHTVGDSVGAIGAVSKSSGMIQGLALGLDMYFSKEDSKQLKKGSETKFAKKIRKVAMQMQATYDELMKLKTVIVSENI